MSKESPSTHHLLIRCPETGEVRPPTEADMIMMCAGANLGAAVGQLLHCGVSAERVRARVEEVLAFLATRSAEDVQ